ncbi:MAG TPA: translocation/assembly module TamB domain-containing protein [Candidatus Bathyarchaeia archaeon]|nr:translocation/assembly module TamB domain-containing protein [Candidatus Bathyarchaeia archaeon]
MRWIGYAAICLAALAVLLVGAAYLARGWLQQRLRQRVVAELEQMTGGRVELQSFRWQLARLEFEARNLTIHGLESSDQAPYAHVDRLLVRLQVLSLLRTQVGIRELDLDHPVVHMIVYPDGSTNQPAPKARTKPAGQTAGPLFELAIDHVQVQHGELLWNDRPLPLDFSARDVLATMNRTSPQNYAARIQVASVDSRYGSFPPLHGKAELQLGLVPGTVELRSFKLVSDHSVLNARGTLTDFRDPKILLTFEGSLDVAEFAALLRLPELRRGMLEINGQGVYRAPDFTASGRVVLKNAEWRQPGLRLPELTAAANYSLTRDRLTISNLNAQTLGGLVSGSAEVTNWSQLGPLTGKALRTQARRRARGSLRLAGVQIAALDAAISTSRLPLDHVNLAGRASGTVDFDWTGSSRDAEATFAFEVAPPANPAPGQLPVTAHVQMVYHGRPGILDIAQLNVATRATRVSASGMLGSTTARMSVELSSDDFSELQSVLAAFREPQAALEVHGHTAFTGSVIGRLTGPTISGHLEISDFDTHLAPGQMLLPAATGATVPPRRLHWDSLAADFVYSPGEFSFHRGLLRRGAAEARFDVGEGLHNGKLEDTSALHGHITVAGADLQDVQLLAGTAYPVTGKLSFKLTLGGTHANPTGQGPLEVTGGTVAGVPFQALRATVALSGWDVTLRDLTLTHNGAQVTGTFAYNFADAAFHFDLTGTNFQLSKFSQLQQPRLTMAGVAGFHLQGSGTAEAPVINIDLHIHDVLLNKEPSGDFDLTGVTHGPDLHLTARSHVQTAELAIDGDIRLRGDFPANITLRFSHFDVNALLRAYLQGKVTGHSSIAGGLDLRGPLRRPRDLNLSGHVDQFSAEIQRVTIQSEGPIQFTLANEFLTLDHLHLKAFSPGRRDTTPTSDITAGGVIQIGGEYEMHFGAEGVLDFGLLQSADPELTSSGKMEINVAVSGTLARPDTSGQVRITDGAVSYTDLPNGLSKINGTLVFNQNRLQVQYLTAQTGGGTLTLGGFINYTHGLSFDLTATSKDIRLRYPPGVSSYADADLRFSGTPENSLLSGTITITKFTVSPQFDLAYYLQRYAQASPAASAQSPLNNLHFDVHIVTAQELQVEMSMAKLSGNADLRLRGTASHPVLLGRVDVAQGNIDIAGTKYHLERGDIVFSNPTTIAPVIDMEANARVRDYDISLGLHGPIAHPSINYRSDPPLPTSDIIALLALGSTQAESGYYQTGPAQSLNELTANAVLEQALANAYSSRAQRLFGASRIKINPQAGGIENYSNARVTIEQQVSDKVTLTFISNVSQSAQQIVQVEYNINRHLSLVAIRDQNGVLSFDVRYRQRKR